MEAPNLQRRCNHVHPGPLTDEARNRAADGGGSDDRLVVGWYAENALKQKILKSSVDKVLGKGKFTASPFEPTATPVVVSSLISSEKATVEYWRLKRLRGQFSGHAIWVRSSILCVVREEEEKEEEEGREAPTPGRLAYLPENAQTM
ncbi:hypothetical protein AB5N19_00566 [Seiridium cardinale]